MLRFLRGRTRRTGWCGCSALPIARWSLATLPLFSSSIDRNGSVSVLYHGSLVCLGSSSRRSACWAGSGLPAPFLARGPPSLVAVDW